MAIIDHSNIVIEEDMVTEPCALRPKSTDILCIRCGWEGHTTTLNPDPVDLFWRHIENGLVFKFHE